MEIPGNHFLALRIWGDSPILGNILDPWFGS